MGFFRKAVTEVVPVSREWRKWQVDLALDFFAEDGAECLVERSFYFTDETEASVFYNSLCHRSDGFIQAHTLSNDFEFYADRDRKIVYIDVGVYEFREEKE